MEFRHPKRSEVVDDTLRQIDGLVDELAALVQEDLPPDEFKALLLRRVVGGLAAGAAAIWSLPLHGELRLDAQLHLSAVGLGDRPPPEHRLMLEEVCRLGTPLVVPPAGGASGDGLNATHQLLVAVPWQVDDEARGVLEVFLPPGINPQGQQGCVDFLHVVAQLLVDYHRNRQVRRFQECAARFRRFERLTRHIHKSLDVRRTAYELANEGRWFLGCDRVTVLGRRGRACRVLAVSGVDTFNRRGNILRRLEHLATVATASGDPLWYTGRTEDRDPRITEALAAYLDQSHATLLAVLPLAAPLEKAPAEVHENRPWRGRPLGALVVERFQGGLEDEWPAAAAALQAQGALALDNALEVRAIPLAGLLRRVGRVRRRLRGWPGMAVLAGCLVLAIAVGMLCTLQTDFLVEAHGKLQPAHLREVFAPDDGIIDAVPVQHAEHVKAGQIVASLRKPDLDFELKRISGELQTAEKRLGAVEAERLRTPPETEEQRRHQGDLTAQEEELRETVRNLGEQRGLLRKQQAELEVRAPLAGSVLTWNTVELLRARPVSRGQTLMTVADLDGPWELEIHIPDKRITPVLTARRSIGPDLGVSFVLATDPATKLRGTLRQISERTEAIESEGSVVAATVGLDRSQVPHLIPGATVIARIDCGRRSVGYVWLHDLIDAARIWFWFS